MCVYVCVCVLVGWEGEREKDDTQAVGFTIMHAHATLVRLTRTSGSDKS